MQGDGLVEQFLQSGAGRAHDARFIQEKAQAAMSPQGGRKPGATAAKAGPLPVSLPVYYQPKFSRNRHAFQDLCPCGRCRPLVGGGGPLADQTCSQAKGAPDLATEPPM